MFRKSALYVSLLVMLVCLISTTACTPITPLTQDSPLTILGTLEGGETMEIVEAHIVVSRGKHIVEERVPVNQGEFQATVRIPVGQWDVTVLLVDALGTVHFQSKPQSTQITVGEPQVLEVQLRPADCDLHVAIDLEGYLFEQVAMRARIHIDDAIHEVIRPDLATPLEKTISLPPGSYEFKIELYTESFRVGDRLGLGVWEIIHILENEKCLITWSPVTEGLHLSGRLEPLLPAPTNLTLAAAAEGVLITWDPVTHWDVSGYFLLVQERPLDRFELLNPVPLQELSYLHNLEPDHPPELTYVVAAVSSSGFVGFYSPPQMWRP
jgi:hypothetical protein